MTLCRLGHFYLVLSLEASIWFGGIVSFFKHISSYQIVPSDGQVMRTVIKPWMSCLVDSHQDCSIYKPGVCLFRTIMCLLK